MLLWLSKHIIYSSLAQAYWRKDSVIHVVSKHRTHTRSWQCQRHFFLLCLPPFYRCINPCTFQCEGNTETEKHSSDGGSTNHHFHYAIFVSSCPSVSSPTTFVNAIRIFFNNSCALSIHLIHIFPPTFILFYVSDIYKRDSYKKWKPKCFISLNLFQIRAQYLSYEIYSYIHRAFYWSKFT